jgi:AraC-like DNA-binding protein
MLFNYLTQDVKRTILSCNYIQHFNKYHADRILKFHDLLYVKEGEWYIAQDNIEYTIKEGDVLLLQSGHRHFGTAPCKSLVKIKYIHFSDSPCDLVEECQNKENFYVFPMVVHCKDNPNIEKYFDLIISSFWSDKPYEKAKASAYLDLLLCEMCSVEIDTQKHTVADEIKSKITKTPHRFVSNEEFAKEYGCSVRTITSKFRESTGKSLHAWQIEQKCRIADELIQNDPSLTLKEVAATFGFYDEYHFSKCFKKIMGRSPKSR